MTARQHILKSAALRGKRKFAEAIAEIENNRSSFDDISLLQAFSAAHEAGDKKAAQSYAEEIKKIAPDVPSIQSYL